MTTGWYERLIAGFGHGLCHQIPERSFEAAGILFPVCSRCTGIYVGFAFALATLLWHYRGRHPAGRVALPVYVFIVVSVLAMAWDGVTSYASIRMTTNLLRLVTGTLFGGSLALVTYAMMIDVLLANRGEERLLGDARSTLWWASACAIAVLFVYLAMPLLGVVAPALVTLALAGTFAAVGTATLGMTNRFRRSVSGWRSAIPVAMWGAALGAAGILTAKLLQAALDRLVELLLI